MSESLSQLLEPIADWFRSRGTPEPIVHWGHPVMMAIVVFVMGSFVGLAGWRGRVLTATDDVAASRSRTDHAKIAPLNVSVYCVGIYRWGVIFGDEF